jgi:tRNA-Thr(GGU) m(6)t(6)A37 methyltransferase TsaA
MIKRSAMETRLTPIGIISSCYKEKFGIPRQAGLVTDARATLELLPPFNRPEAVQGLESFTHLWLLFIFHQSAGQGWKPTVRPPRLGGNRRMGVFATRSPFRPNSIGLSAVELEKIECKGSRILLHLKGVDVMDGTPVVDIKPYLPYADCIATAGGGFADEAPGRLLEVCFTPEIAETVRVLEENNYPGLRQLIIDTLRADPRPAYYQRQPQKNSFGMKIHDFDLRWQFSEGRIVVSGLVKESSSG